VVLKIVYLLIRRLPGLAVLVFRTDLAKDEARPPAGIPGHRTPRRSPGEGESAAGDTAASMAS
jgi:hypothetical protein